MKHIEIAAQQAHQAASRGSIVFVDTDTSQQLADALTKPVKRTENLTFITAIMADGGPMTSKERTIRPIDISKQLSRSPDQGRSSLTFRDTWEEEDNEASSEANNPQIKEKANAQSPPKEAAPAKQNPARKAPRMPRGTASGQDHMSEAATSHRSEQRPSLAKGSVGAPIPGSSR